MGGSCRVFTSNWLALASVTPVLNQDLGSTRSGEARDPMALRDVPLTTTPQRLVALDQAYRLAGSLPLTTTGM